MDLKVLIKHLQEYGKPHTACSWDNTGLLVEPSGAVFIKKILLTCDLTESVFDEAIQENVDLIISYHPAISFETPLKRLTQANWEERSIIKCIEKRIAVYSPHTTWDNKNGGINDWIMQAFDTKRIESVENNSDKSGPCGFSQSVYVNLPNDANLEKLFSNTLKLSNLRFLGRKEILTRNENLIEIEFLSSEKGVLKLIDMISELYGNSVLSTLRVNQIKKPLMKNVGLGRIGQLVKPMKISDLLNLMKSYLKMTTFRLALGHGKNLDDFVSTIAVGAGCCSSLLNNVPADFIITGEFLHEEIVHEVSRGVSLILTDHTNTERGYLSVFEKALSKTLNSICQDIQIIVSKIDRDPLVYT